MAKRLTTGQDRYEIWNGLVGSQTAAEFWTESQAQGATTYREAAEAYVEHLKETQGLVSEAGWPEEDVPVLVDMLVEVMEEELGPQAPSSLTWQVREDNGGGLHLAVFEGERCIYHHQGYEFGQPGQLLGDIEALRNGAHPIRDGWEGNAGDPQAVHDEMVGYEYGWTVVADQDGVYYDRMGAAATHAFAIPWQDLKLFDTDNQDITDEERIVRALREFTDTGTMYGAFFHRIGASHEDEEDASTWGPLSPDHVDWTGFPS